jgi:hypothetical protein
MEEDHDPQPTQAKYKILFKKNELKQKEKGSGVWLKCYRTCLANSESKCQYKKTKKHMTSQN